ncbi:MAG: NUDIX hydrolase [Anaerolineales bacterium]|nr:NUDIX hydrolase [Anaerolineales bacterium]
MAYVQTGSETVYTGKVFNIRIDQVRAPDGKIRQIDVVEHGGAVAFLPVDHDGSILFVRQYRHPTGQELLEIPAGTLEKGENRHACVIRECREEVGFTPAKVTLLGSCYLAPGYSTEKIWIYLAEDLTPDPLPGDEDEDISIEKIRIDAIPSLIAQGQLIDAKSIVGLHLLQSHQAKNTL